MVYKLREKRRTVKLQHIVYLYCNMVINIRKNIYIQITEKEMKLVSIYSKFDGSTSKQKYC